jgi:hypothetical protein
MQKILVAILALTVLPACAMNQKKVEQSITDVGPPDCATAEGDLRVLESERANVVEEIAEGVTAITPAGIVLGILMGTEGEKFKVASGEYNRALERRIAETKEHCGIE